MKHSLLSLFVCVVSFMACSSSPSEPAIPEVPMFGVTNIGLEYQLNFTDDNIKSYIQLMAVTSKLSGDRPTAQFKLFNTYSLGEKQITATWQWTDVDGMDVGAGTFASRPTSHQIDSRGYLTLQSSAPSTDAVSVSLRLREAD